jgi:hypothetical protein
MAEKEQIKIMELTADKVIEVLRDLGYNANKTFTQGQTGLNIIAISLSGTNQLSGTVKQVNFTADCWSRDTSSDAENLANNISDSLDKYFKASHDYGKYTLNSITKGQQDSTTLYYYSVNFSVNVLTY